MRNSSPSLIMKVITHPTIMYFYFVGINFCQIRSLCTMSYTYIILRTAHIDYKFATEKVNLQIRIVL